MRPSYRPAISPQPPPYHTQIFEHLGLVAGMFDELGIGEVLDQATRQNPEMRDLTVGEAVNARVLNGLGFINQALSLVPRFFQNKPTSRLIAPRVTPKQLNDDALGRALETLDDSGVTALFSLLAATAAQRLGLASRFVHLDSPSFHVDGRYNSDEEPEEHVIHSTRGYSRDQRPDLNQVMLDLIVAHQAGIPVLMQPLSGNSRDVHAFGQIITDHLAQLQLTYGPTCLVAASALYSAENLQKLAATQTPWITRVPATLSEAQAVLAHADPQTMAPLTEGDRSHVERSSDGGVEPRGMRIHSEPRQPQAQRTMDKQLLKYSEQEGQAFKRLCRPPFACEADAQQALATFAQGVQATVVAQSPVRPRPR
jgi:transposase